MKFKLIRFVGMLLYTSSAFAGFCFAEYEKCGDAVYFGLKTQEICDQFYRECNVYTDKRVKLCLKNTINNCIDCCIKDEILSYILQETPYCLTKCVNTLKKKHKRQ